MRYKRPLGALERGGSQPSPTFNFSFKNIFFFFGWGVDIFFLGAIDLGRVVVPCTKIVINLPWTYKKLHCKGNPYRFSG